MFSVWTEHLKDEKSKKDFYDSVKYSEVLQRLRDIVTNMEKALDRSEISIDNYEKPNWRERQAHKNGYRECLNKIQKLLTTDHKESK